MSDKLALGRPFKVLKVDATIEPMQRQSALAPNAPPTIAWVESRVVTLQTIEGDQGVLQLHLRNPETWPFFELGAEYTLQLAKSE